MEWLIQLSITYDKQFHSALEGLFQWAVTSSTLILIVLAVRFLFRKKLSARLRYALWAVVLLRLLVPFQVELPADTSAALPVLASNLAPELPKELGRPLSPDTAWLHAWTPAEDIGLGDVTISEDGTLHSIRPTDLPVLDPETGDALAYKGGLTWEVAIVLLWAAGAGLTGAVILLSNLRFAFRLRKRRTRLEGVDAPIPVYVVEGLPSPCLFGVFRPAVYITPEAAEDLDTLRHILAHELTHYAHFDHLWSLLRCLALALHWYNPLVWLAVGLSKGDGELACDEGAVARLGEAERIPYGRTLVDMVAKRSPRPGDLLSCSTAMTGGETSIKRRVTQIVKKPETVKAALFAAIALVALSAVFVFAERAQPKDNTMFRDQLDLASSIRYRPSPLSSQSYPDPISDPDLLAQAKEALSGFTYLDSGDPGPDLQMGLISTARIVLNTDSTETPYTLLWQDGRSYLFPGDMWEEEMKLRAEYGEGAHIQGTSGTMQAKPGVDVAAVLENLARRQRSRIEEKLTLENEDVASLYVAPNEEPERVHPVTGPKEELPPDLENPATGAASSEQISPGPKPRTGQERVHPVTDTGKSDTDGGKEEWEKQQTAEYQAAGVTMDGKSYYYQGQLVNIFLDIRANQSFYTLDTNPAGAVNVKIIRDKDDKISGVEYMSDEEAAALLADLRDD